MRILAQDVKVVSAAVRIGGTEGDTIDMESAESPMGTEPVTCGDGGGVKSRRLGRCEGGVAR